MTVEPPHIGFTGKVWDAIPADRLAQELVDGAGSLPMANAGVAWGKLAAGLTAAGAEYDVIMGQLGQAWMSGNGEDAVGKMRAMQTWLGDIAEAAAANGDKAAHQASAYEIARMTMPDAGEITSAQTSAHHLLHATAIGAPMVGAIAQVEDTIDTAKKQAARVMQTYEAASAPLAAPWEQPHPPAISADDALQAERAAGGATSSEPAVPVGQGGGTGSVQQAQVQQVQVQVNQTAYTAEQLVQAQPVAVATNAVAPVPAHVSASDALLAAPVSSAMQPMDEDHVSHVVAALDQGEIDRLWASTGYATAPAVLGGVGPAPTAQQVAPIAPQAGAPSTEA